jgi:5-methylcytosine-specific restriction endonuclease McrA
MREDMAERLAALACKAMFDTSMVRGVGVAPPSATSSRTKKSAYEAILYAFKCYGKRRVIPKKVRTQIFKRDGYRCAYCGKHKSEVKSLHVDHRIPVVEGGVTGFTNLVTACDVCNFSKGAKMLKQANNELHNNTRE